MLLREFRSCVQQCVPTLFNQSAAHHHLLNTSHVSSRDVARVHTALCQRGVPGNAAGPCARRGPSSGSIARFAARLPRNPAPWPPSIVSQPPTATRQGKKYKGKREERSKLYQLTVTDESSVIKTRVALIRGRNHGSTVCQGTRRQRSRGDYHMDIPQVSLRIEVLATWYDLRVGSS